MSTVSPRAAIIAIGSEMLGTLRRDTNSLWLTGRLEEAGFTVVRKSIVGDDPGEISRELSCASAAAAWIFTTGGLGPTADDLTVAAVARWAGRGVRRDEEFVAAMRRRWERRGIPMPAVNEKQADFIEGARVLANPRGTAPGFWLDVGGVQVLILPGVPSEMKEIFGESIEPELFSSSAITTRRRVLRIAAMAESAVEELVAPLYAKWSSDPVTILASPGEVELHLSARGTPAEAAARLQEMEDDFVRVLGSRIHGRDDEGLAATVGRLLTGAGKTVALAESCTGGLASTLLTDVPGSSAYFLGSVVSYADSAKKSILDVSGDTLRDHGAVSAEAAREMARGALARFGSDLAVAITGIAGPDGGSEAKPVGTVFFALVDRGGRESAKKRVYGGDRATVRRASAMFTLELIRRFLTEAK
jgi:nicotinamide-nucleotide amidase